MVLKFVKNRDGDMIEFNILRIKEALMKAYKATNVPAEDIDSISQNVVAELEKLHDDQSII